MLKVVLCALGLATSVSTVAAAQPLRLTPDGLGPLRIGMPERELVRRFHFVGPHDDPADAFACSELGSDDWPGVGVMTERHRVTRISLFKGSHFEDARHVRIGASEARVIRAYGPSLRKEHRAYEDRPAGYLTYLRHDGRGIRYELDADGRVAVIHAGGPSIQYIEGCQ